jgi:hypothetical protein
MLFVLPIFDFYYYSNWCFWRLGVFKTCNNRITKNNKKRIKTVKIAFYRCFIVFILNTFFMFVRYLIKDL